MNSGIDEHIFNTIDGDMDGTLFWHGRFGDRRVVSFESFIGAYQAYLIHAFTYRRFTKQQLITLLRHTLLQEMPESLRQVGAAPAKATAGSAAELMSSEVSVELFALWLRRFGPLKDTLDKAAALSLPNEGQCVRWFQTTLDRDMSELLIRTFVKRSAQGQQLQPEQLFIARYSSVPDYHFIFTVQPHGSSTIEHFGG